MRKDVFSKVGAGMLAAVIMVSSTGCSMTKQENLMDAVTPKEVAAETSMETGNVAVTDFAVRLFRASLEEEKNTLISPLSVLNALAMTANGAREETLSQMETVLGMPISELNTYLHTYMQQLPEEKTYKLSLANSIWALDDENFVIEQDFLQTNADYYDADIYKTKFDDATLKAINNWVKDNTDGMIPEILERIPEDALMYLVNALAFEAEWQDTYEASQVREGIFTTASGEEKKVQMMYSDEYWYLEDENATGLIKYYDDRAYAFVALMPREGISVADYVACLTGEHLNELLLNPVRTGVDAAIPKFETEYSTEMSEILAGMGMPDAFDGGKADFTGLGTIANNNIAISRVMHKTFISVGEKGTKAGAATVVEMAEGAAIYAEDPKTVHLDRPFVYMLVDCENNLPFFVGALVDIEE